MTAFRSKIEANVADARAKKTPTWEAGYRLAMAQSAARKAKRVAEAEAWLAGVKARPKTGGRK